MAFGDEREVVEAAQDGVVSITATYATATPSVDDLNIANHFTGNAVSNVDTSGFTEDQLLTNAGQADQGAIYSQLVTGSGDDTVTCSSGSSDENLLIFVLVGGPFATTPKDLSDTSGVTTDNPATTGVSVSDIAQADEYMNAILCIRVGPDKTEAWNRLGDATPTSDMTELTGGGISTPSKRVEAAGQVLTGVGTVGVSRAAVGFTEMLGYATYRRAPPPPPPLPQYGQRRAVIGDPPVYGATIVRS